MLFRCRVCEEKDKRIADLKSEIARLTQISFPNNHKLPIVHLEADAVLSGRQETIDLTKEENIPTQEAAISERSRILGGTYDVQY